MLTIAKAMIMNKESDDYGKEIRNKKARCEFGKD
jgi:hypothetical protein